MQIARRGENPESAAREIVPACRGALIHGRECARSVLALFQSSDHRWWESRQPGSSHQCAIRVSARAMYRMHHMSGGQGYGSQVHTPKYKVFVIDHATSLHGLVKVRLLSWQGSLSETRWVLCVACCLVFSPVPALGATPPFR